MGTRIFRSTAVELPFRNGLSNARVREIINILYCFWKVRIDRLGFYAISAIHTFFISSNQRIAFLIERKKN